MTSLQGQRARCHFLSISLFRVCPTPGVNFGVICMFSTLPGHGDLHPGALPGSVLGSASAAPSALPRRIPVLRALGYGAAPLTAPDVSHSGETLPVLSSTHFYFLTLILYSSAFRSRGFHILILKPSKQSNSTETCPSSGTETPLNIDTVFNLCPSISVGSQQSSEKFFVFLHADEEKHLIILWISPLIFLSVDAQQLKIVEIKKILKKE